MSFGHSQNTENYYSLDNHTSLSFSRGIFFLKINMKIDILKTESHHKDFQKLVRELDLYLAEIDGEDHSFYAQYNKLDAIKNCIIIYIDKEPIACGAYKKYDDQTIEVKRMFTKEQYRGKGYAKMVLLLLEKWAKEEGYNFSVLETGVQQVSAVHLYEKSGYSRIPNYEPYENVENSICFLKQLVY